MPQTLAAYFSDEQLTMAKERVWLLGLIVIGCALLYSVGIAIYRIWFSPLSTIPGPWYAAVSDLWLFSHAARFRLCRIVHECFLQYGPIVRLGPSKVAFLDAAAAKDIYGNAWKFPKSSFYAILQVQDVNNSATSLEHAPHAARRRAVGPHYSAGHLALFQPEIHNSVLEVVSVLDKHPKNTSADCLSLFQHLMLDINALSIFGSDIGAVKTWEMGSRNRLAAAVHDFPPRGVLRNMLPRPIWNLMVLIPHKGWRTFYDADSVLAIFAGRRVNEMREQLDGGKPLDSEKTPLITRLLTYRPSSSTDILYDPDVIAECAGHMVAGSETTSATMSYICWELSRRPDIFIRLRAEVDDAMPDSRIIPDFTVLQRLPYLNALIKEGLRLYGAAPSPLERIVPASFSSPNKSLLLKGYTIPPGTIVMTQAWSMHRTPSIFPSAEMFMPERWLDISEEERGEMQAHSMPYGMGSRICAGQHLAQMSLCMVIASLAKNFEIVTPAATTEKTMYITDAFSISPAAKECQLIFIPREL